ncbi:YceI family protein [Streptomyces sp. NPDC088725]|uniref:YceI family protein n=1 Tax=Streptomyces sp. NPDC088725 TaxID=3365873 RepID=UPI0037FC0127
MTTDPARGAHDGTPVLPKGTWHIDPLHSHVGFVARHLGFVRVRGHFTDVEGTIRIADPVEETTAEVRVAMASVDTGVPTRDEHLRSAEFFDIVRFPVMEFRGQRVRRAPGGEGPDGGEWEWDGELTITGTTRPVTLTGRFLGQDVYPFTGGRRLAFTGHTTVDRRDFGITALPPLPGAQIFVGATVDIDLEISMVEGDIGPVVEQFLGRRLAL